MEVICPTWPASHGVKALITTRIGGASLPPYHSLNLGSHVGDDRHHVEQNRQLLNHYANLPSSPIWLTQTHSNSVVNLDCHELAGDLHYDGSYTSKSGLVCAVLTADCLPVFICSTCTDEIALVHAGWRGLSEGIIENALRFFQCQADTLMAWLGPAIGPTQFEVGVAVKNQFEANSREASKAFQLIDKQNQKYLANIYLLAKQRLNAMGVFRVFGGEYCTVSDSDRFFSYRRQAVTGRMASLIWIDKRL